MTTILTSHPLLSESFAFLDGVSRNPDSTEEALEDATHRIRMCAEPMLASLPNASAERLSIEEQLDTRILEGRRAFHALHENGPKKPSAAAEEEEEGSSSDVRPQEEPPSVVEDTIRPEIAVASLLQDLLQLDDSQKATVQRMLDQWHLGPDIRLLSILGVDLYHKMNSLKPCLSKKDLNQKLSSFASRVFYISTNFVSIIQNPIERLGMVNQLRSFTELRSSLEQQKNAEHKQVRKNPDKLREWEEKYEEAERIMKEIEATLDIFSKIMLQNPVPLAQSLWASSKTTPLPPCYASHANTVEQLGIYADFCALMTKVARDQGISAIDHPYFYELAQACEEIKSKRPLPSEDVKKVKDILNNGFTHIGKALHDNASTTARALVAPKPQKKTPSSSKLKRRERLIQEKEQTALAEKRELEASSRNANRILTLDFFQSEFQNVFDQVVAEDYPRSSSMIENQERLLHHLKRCPSEAPQHREIKPPPRFPADFNAEFCTAIAHTESLFSIFLSHATLRVLRSEKMLASLGEQMHYPSKWKAALQDLAPFCDLLLDLAKKNITDLPNQLTRSLATQMESLNGTLSEKEKEDIEKYVRDVCFKQTLFLAHMIMLLEDIDAIVKGRFSLEECKYLPQELVDLMQLSGVDELMSSLSTLPAEQEPAAQEEVDEVEEIEEESFLVPPEIAAPGEEESPEGKENEVASLPQAHKAAPLPDLRSRTAQPPAPAPAKAVRAKEPLKFKKGAKTWQILKQLREEGFCFTRRGRGSHALYEGPDGQKTIVSRHSGRKVIPIGTLRSIARDIAPLQSEEKDG